MRLIDKKWKLFGMINLFDLFVLCSIIFLAFLSYRWIMVAEDPSFIKAESVYIQGRGFIKVQGFLADMIKEGDVMLDRKGDIICKIEKIESIEPVQQIVYQSKDGEKIFSNSEQVKIKVIFYVMAYKRENALYFENLGCPVARGAVMNIKTKEYSCDIYVTELLTKV